MFKAVEPKKHRHSSPAGMKTYVRVTPRLFYISSAAGKLFGNHERCNISIDVPGKVMIISPGGQWKLSTVCETKNAKRIETPNTTISFLEAGFPKGLLGKYLPCFRDISGCLVVGLTVDYDMIKGKAV